jgi:heptosyltransferase-1
MHILIIKTSSLGDVIHTLPALTDALGQFSQLQADWVIEPTFAEIPTWHPAVKRVIPVALRKWRRRPWHTWHSGTWHQFIETLREQRYDYVIDAQGLMKSAILAYQARGRRGGYDWHSAREPLASLAYQQRYAIAKNQHAVTRLRQLFAGILNYSFSSSSPVYGIASHFPPPHKPPKALPRLIFLHGTSWPSKLWPERYWIALAQRATTAGFTIRLLWGNEPEKQRAQRIAATNSQVEIIPLSNLQHIAQEMVQAQAVVGVDTGLAHLAAALAVPSITIYGATQPLKTGTYGAHAKHLTALTSCAPCFKRRCRSLSPFACYQTITVERVWEALGELINI